jgi:hypothetical protein
MSKRIINNKGVYNENQNNSSGSSSYNAGQDITVNQNNEGNSLQELQVQKASTQKDNTSTQIIVAVIGLIGVIITAVLLYLGNRNLTEIPIQATQTAEARLTNVALSALPTISPIAPLINAPPPSATAALMTSSLIGYDFENDTQGWQSSEADHKLARLDTSEIVAYHGQRALVLETELYGSGSDEFRSHNSDDVYRHTEVLVYFNQIPEGLDRPGPYDLTGKRLSCFVYLPTGLIAPDITPPAYVRLILKDKNFANQFSEPVMISSETTENWLELIYVVNPDVNSNFDTTQVNAMGVRLDSLDNSTVNYSGPVYIDFCTIGS